MEDWDGKPLKQPKKKTRELDDDDKAALAKKKEEQAKLMGGRRGNQGKECEIDEKWVFVGVLSL